MKKVAYVITELNVGGAEQCLTQLATGIDRSRFEPQAISLDARPGPGSDGLVTRLEQQGISVSFLNARSNLAFPLTLLRLRRLLATLRPDIVHTFLFHANVLGTFAARSLRIRKIITSIRVADPRSARRVERWIVPCVRQVCCVSESVRQFAIRSGFAPSKLCVIPNGVDTTRFSPKSSEVACQQIESHRSQTPIVTFVGRLDPQKGLDILLAAWSVVAHELPNARLQLVGDGPQRASIEAHVKSLGISGSVDILGHRSDIPTILQNSQLFVLPSRWEGMPNALLEAMAGALPVVASSAEGIEEVLGPLSEHQLLTELTAERLASAIVFLAKNSGLARNIGHENRQRIVERYSLTKMVEQYERLYDSISS